jgi:hypothetical protein
MGNQASAPAVQQMIAQARPTPPVVVPDPAAQCTANKIKASQLKNQLDDANNSIDKCDPSVKLARTQSDLKSQNEQFVQQQVQIRNTLINSLQEKFRTGNDLAESIKLLKHYEKEIKSELMTDEKDIVKLNHDERKYRRDFLDNHPTDGVPWHIFGLQTSDDKVMLTFWITALLSFSLLAHIIITILTPNESFQGRALKGGISVIVALVACYMLIIYNG